MIYNKTFIMKNGKECTIRNGVAEDGEAMYEHYVSTHSETDYLLSYPEEHAYNIEGESNFLKKEAESDNEVMLLAFVDGKIVGSSGITSLGNKYKIRHRADFGITVCKEYWGLGIGRVLMNSCVECAKNAGYEQLELEVVADNSKAIAMYKSIGFIELGRNPKGFKSKYSGYQELVHMGLEL